MGSSNVALVYALWGHLPDHAFRALGYMALVTLDADTPPIFWQGVPALALALGRVLPEDPGDDNSIAAENVRKTREAISRAVKRAVSVCVSEGAVRVVRKPSPGKHAVYSLHLSTAVDGPVDNPIVGDVGGGPPGSRGTSGVGHGGHLVSERGTPRGTRLGGVGGGDLHQRRNKEEEQTQVDPSPHLGLSTSELEKQYLSARAILEKLPDLGMQYLARVEEIESLRERVIVAADLAAIDLKRRRTA